MWTKTVLKSNLSSKWRGVQLERTFQRMNRSCYLVNPLRTGWGHSLTSPEALMEAQAHLSLIWNKLRQHWAHSNHQVLYPKSYLLRAAILKDKPNSRIVQGQEWCPLRIQWHQYRSWSHQLLSHHLKWQWHWQERMHTASNIKRNNYPPAMEEKTG
jgi:hypothetical protein